MFKTIVTLIRGSAAEAEEALFDANAIRILEQKVREVSDAFEALKRSLAHVMSMETGERRSAERLASRIPDLEKKASTALAAGDETQARVLAGRIAGFEDERTRHLEAAERCATDASDLHGRVDDAALRLGELKRGLVTARSAAALERARRRTGRLPHGSSDALREAEAVLRRVRERQYETRAYDDALEKIERDLPLSAAGEDDAARPRSSADDVLVRLRAGMKSATDGPPAREPPPS